LADGEELMIFFFFNFQFLFSTCTVGSSATPSHSLTIRQAASVDRVEQAGKECEHHHSTVQ
jgi:hypothetical protein